MRAWIRLLTVCLMAMALPVQGLASAAMVHCGTGHEHMRGDQNPLQHDSAHQHDDADQASHHHDAAEPAKAAKLTELAKSKCSSCASCCTGLALLTVMPSVPEPGPVVTTFVMTTVDIVPVAQTGPDRPPRPSIA